MLLFMILLTKLAFGFETSIIKIDTPVAYKRYIEVTTIHNQGEDLPSPFLFTLVMDLRIPEDENRILMSAITWDLANAGRAHEESIEWVMRNYAHLKVTIPDSTDGLVLRFLEPTLRSRVMDYSQSDPLSSRRQDTIVAPTIQDIQSQMVNVIPSDLT